MEKAQKNNVVDLEEMKNRVQIGLKDPVCIITLMESSSESLRNIKLPGVTYLCYLEGKFFLARSLKIEDFDDEDFIKDFTNFWETSDISLNVFINKVVIFYENKNTQNT